MSSAIGHNRPPEPPRAEEVVEILRDQFSHLAGRAEALAGSVSRFVQAHPELHDDHTQGVAAEVVRQVRTHLRLVESKRTEAKAPYLEAGKTVDGWFKALAETMRDIRKVEAAMTDYARRIEAERRRVAEEDARRAREDAARTAALAAIADTEDAEAVAELAAAQAARATDAAAVKPAELSRVHGEYGAVSSLVETWNFELEDINLVPAIYLRVDEVAVRRAIHRDRVREIPGLRIYSTKSVRVR